MIHTSLLSRRPDQGAETYWNYDEVTGEATIETFTAVGGFMERNHERYKRWTATERHGDMELMGSIPLAKYFVLQKAGIIDDDPFQKKFRKWCRENYREYQRWFAVPKDVL